MTTRAFVLGLSILAAACSLGTAQEPPKKMTDEEFDRLNNRAKVFAQMESDQKVLARGPVGRYQIVMSTIVARDTYLLDTSTGRTWVILSAKDDAGKENGLPVWAELERRFIISP